MSVENFNESVWMRSFEIFYSLKKNYIDLKVQTSPVLKAILDSARIWSGMIQVPLGETNKRSGWNLRRMNTIAGGVKAKEMDIFEEGVEIKLCWVIMEM